MDPPLLAPDGAAQGLLGEAASVARASDLLQLLDELLRKAHVHRHAASG